MAIKIQPLRTLRLKVKAEGYAWLNAAAIEVDQVWNFANASSYKAARPFAGQPKWLTAVPFKAVQLKRKGKSLRFSGKALRVFERKRLEGAMWKCGCFAQDSVGDWAVSIEISSRKLPMHSAALIIVRPSACTEPLPGDERKPCIGSQRRLLRNTRISSLAM
jgi:hypothetical protein